MEIKRNIFESSARMPKRYESVASTMVPEDREPNAAHLPGHENTSNDVRHARSPRVGEQK